MVEKAMTVLHVITGLNDGGAEGALYRLCVHDRSSTHVVVSMMDGGKYGPLLEAAGVTVYGLNMAQGKPTLAGLWHLWRLVRQIRPHAVQTWLYHADLLGGVVARLAGVRHICWGIRHSNLTPGTVKRSTIWVVRLCATLSHWVPQRIVSCSQQAVPVHTALGYDASKFVVIPNGYELSHYAPNVAARKRLRLALKVGDKAGLLGMVARFDAQKDHSNLLAALGELKRGGNDFHCVLVGTGMEQGNVTLQQWLVLEDIVDRVTLLGRRNDIPDIMNALDIHVLCSLGEAFPNVLAEAMACGTPCVSTDVGDAALIVGDTGWVVPPQNSAALAEALRTALNARGDSQAWSRRQLSARARIEELFTIEQAVRMYRSVWQDSRPVEAD